MTNIACSKKQKVDKENRQFKAELTENILSHFAWSCKCKADVSHVHADCDCLQGRKYETALLTRYILQVLPPTTQPIQTHANKKIANMMAL